MDSFERLTGFREADYYDTRGKLVVEGDQLRPLANGKSSGIGYLNLSPLPTFAKTALDLELAEGTVIADQVGEIDCIFLAIAPNGLLPNSC